MRGFSHSQFPEFPIPLYVDQKFIDEEVPKNHRYVYEEFGRLLVYARIFDRDIEQNRQNADIRKIDEDIAPKMIYEITPFIEYNVFIEEKGGNKPHDAADDIRSEVSDVEMQKE